MSDARWTGLVSAARRERVVPVLGAAVHDGRLPVTDVQSEQASAAWLDVMRQCLRVDGSMMWLLDELGSLGIATRVLKGTAVAHLDYARPQDRQFGDLDILVPSGDLPRVIALLESHGYERRYPEPRPGFDREYTKSVSLRGEVEIDVHRTICDAPIGHRIPVDQLWGGSSRFVVAGHAFEALPPPARFIHSCLHAYLAPPPSRLSSLLDVARAIAGDELDPDVIDELSARWRVRSVVDAAVSAAIVSFNRPLGLDSRWTDADAPTLVDAVLVESHRQPGATSAVRALLALMTIGGATRRARYVAHLALPRRSYYSARYQGGAERLRRAIEQFSTAVRGQAR